MTNIIFLGLVSFFADLSAEMVYPIIPLYLASAFGATPVLLGIIEGIAESLASLLKVFSGYMTDRYDKKKSVAFIGYATGLVYKAALILASSWRGILLARVIDRIGKGIRTSPRDVMVCESSEKGKAGLSFGVHKAFDMAGSALGILIAYFLIRNLNGVDAYKKIFMLSAIPAGLCLIMFFKIKEAKKVQPTQNREPFWHDIKNLDSQLKLYLFVAFLFTLGNSSNAFLLLRGKSIGFRDDTIILLYFIYNITASFLAIPAGKRSDKVGPKQLLVAGYFVFAFVYVGFAFANDDVFMVALFVLYGAYTAMTAGVERAFIAEISPQNLKGTMLGMHATIVGLSLLPASVIAGSLWVAFGPRAPFLFGSFMSFGAAVILLLFMKGKSANSRSNS